jgi:hypothetical protein
LAGLGLSDQAISYRVKQGRLFRVHWCVYAVGRPPHTPLERASAAVLACGPGAALSHLGALALWGFASTWPASFEAVVEADRRPIGVRTHRFTCLERHDTRVQLGIRATSPARTILDCAPRLDPRTRTRTVNDALHSPLLTRAQLADVRTRFALHRGAKLLDPFLDAGDGPTRSDLEDDFAAFCARFGLPRPHTNVRVAGHEVDALFPAHRLIVELDGWEFHRDRDAFEDDRDRDADTLQAGFPTIRVTYGRLHDRAEAEAARLRRILNARR